MILVVPFLPFILHHLDDHFVPLRISPHQLSLLFSLRMDGIHYFNDHAKGIAQMGMVANGSRYTPFSFCLVPGKPDLQPSIQCSCDPAIWWCVVGGPVAMVPYRSLAALFPKAISATPANLSPADNFNSDQWLGGHGPQYIGS